MAEKRFVDYYDVLGIGTDAGQEQVKLAYKRLAKQHHPDVGGSTEYMQELNTAYRTLVSAASRRSYDLLYDFHIGLPKIESAKTVHTHSPQLDDMSDREIDDFIDTIYAEYKAQPKPKKTLLTRLRNLI